MLLRRIVVVWALVLAMNLAASTASAAPGKGRKKSRPVNGVVTEVVTQENGQGTITIKAKAGKKKGATNAKASEKKFTITKDTKFVKASGKKGKGETKDAAFRDVAKKARVIVITTKSGAVEKVTLLSKKKKG